MTTSQIGNAWTSSAEHLSKKQIGYYRARLKNRFHQLVLEKWHRLGIAPSPVASDSEFIRRAFLDALGTLPTPEEVQQFLSDPSPDKRAQWIGGMLDRTEYADFWANL